MATKCWTWTNVFGALIALGWVALIITGIVYFSVTHHTTPAVPVARLSRGGGGGSASQSTMVREAPCNGPDKPPVTRHDIWSTCFIPLVDNDPRDGYITQKEVQAFLSNHLHWWERWVAPSAATISADCDADLPYSPKNGRVNWPKFHATETPGCIGIADHICRVNDVCNRELAAQK